MGKLIPNEERKRRKDAYERALSEGYAMHGQPGRNRGSARNRASNLLGISIGAARNWELVEQRALEEKKENFYPNLEAYQPLKDLSITPENVHRKNLEKTIKELSRELENIVKENLEAAQVRDQIFKIAAKDPEPPSWIFEKPGENQPGVPVVLWSDWHIGEIVKPENIEGINKFNLKIAEERVRFTVERHVSLIKQQGDIPGVIVCINGDIVNGAIHDELEQTNEIPPIQQMMAATDWIWAGLLKFEQEFGRVHVFCTFGNHGRDGAKRTKDLAAHSFDWNIGCLLQRYALFAKKDKKITFTLPDSGDAHFKIYDKRFLLTHGDMMGVRGGDGIIGALGPIMRGTVKVRTQQIALGRQVDCLLLGHWHYGVVHPRVIVNDSLKGYDEFARALRMDPRPPAQMQFHVHPSYGVHSPHFVFSDPPRRSVAREKWLSIPYT